MKRSIAAVSIAILSGCVATDVGNPQDNPPSDRTTEIEVEMEAFVEAQSPAALTLADGVELTEAWLMTAGIELQPCEVEGTEEETEETETEEIEGEESESEAFGSATATELLTGTSYPASPLFGLDMVDFCGFALEPAVLPVDEIPDGAPAELAELSMLVRGTLKDGTPFEVRADLEDTFELEGEIHLDDARLNQLIVGFVVNDWLTQRDLGALSGQPIVVSPEENTEIYERFEDAVLASPRLFVGNTSRRPIAMPEE